MRLDLVFFKKIIGVITVLVALFWAMSTYANWDFSRIGNEQTIPLSGKIVTTDGMVNFYPEVLSVDYQEMIVVIRYDIHEELKELGFDYASAPRFSIEENPELEPELNDLPISYKENIIRANDVHQRKDEEGSYFEAHFYYTDMPHYEPNATYRLYLIYPGSLQKEVSKQFDIEVGKTNKIDFPGIGSYHLDLNFHDPDQNTLMISRETRSSLGNHFFHVHDNIVGVNNNVEVTTGNGTGSGSRLGESNIYKSQSKTTPDTSFFSAERYIVKIHNILLDLEHDIFEEKYLDL